MIRAMALDIHDYDTKYEYAQRQVRLSDLSPRNKDLIFQYRDACLVKNVCGRVRLIRILGVLLLLGRTLKKDFDTVAKADIEQLVAALVGRQPPYSPQTLGTYKIILKSFFTWVFAPERFPTQTNVPEQVAWITGHVRKRDKQKLERADLLTPQDVKALLNVCHNPRDVALIAVLWETGARIAEIGNLQLKHLTKNQHGYTLDLNGKTGARNPLIISSAPYLTQWCNNHPFKNNPESPLWVHYQYKEAPHQLKYDTIRHLLCRYFARAKVQKPFHPHIFRHSRATYVLANGIMNESQAKTYFGWTPDSDMLATYSHLTSGDANEALLRENNLTTQQKRRDELLPMACRICGELNQPNAEYCNRCGAVLDLRKAYEHQTAHRLKDEVFINVFRMLVDKGLVDDAAKQIRDAGLGETLRRLALHAQGGMLTPATTPTAQPADAPTTCRADETASLTKAPSP